MYFVIRHVLQEPEPKFTSIGAQGPKVVYQNPDDPFGKKEVFVPAPRKRKL